MLKTQTNFKKKKKPRENLSEHTLNCYGWFPEHIGVFQQLRLVSVDGDDLTASAQNSAVAQPEVTHSTCKRQFGS